MRIRHLTRYLATALAVPPVLATGVGAASAVEPPPELRAVTACDAAVCVVAWDVVDSDGDSVSDADELLAGTDPHDPTSHPPMLQLLELAGARRLPSLEAGQAFVVVFPPDLQAKRAELEAEALPTLPLGPERKDALTTAGISASLLAEHGVDASTEGFTIGLDGPSKAGERPPVRVGGIDVSLISADEEDLAPIVPNADHIVRTEQDGRNTIYFFDNGHIGMWDPKTGTYTELDEKGKKVRGYVNPDADDPTAAPTAEQLDAWQRRQGAAVRTIEGWSAPGSPEEPPADRRSLIVLIDPAVPDAVTMVFEQPRVTTAQPETDPNLPHPSVPPEPPSGTAGH